MDHEYAFLQEFMEINRNLQEQNRLFAEVLKHLLLGEGRKESA